MFYGKYSIITINHSNVQLADQYPKKFKLDKKYLCAKYIEPSQCVKDNCYRLYSGFIQHPYRFAPVFMIRNILHIGDHIGIQFVFNISVFVKRFRKHFSNVIPISWTIRTFLSNSRILICTFLYGLSKWALEQYWYCMTRKSKY